MLDRSPHNELFSLMPFLHLLPKAIDYETGNHFRCPLYRTVVRRGVLSTTGHSTNLVMYVELPTQEEEDNWIRAGIALVLCHSQ